jgi:hypothetical protein
MPERRKKKKGASGVAASAVATVTAAGVLVGGAYSSPEELMNDGPVPVVDTLLNNDVPADDGGLGPSDFEEEMAGAEDEEKRGVRAAVRKRMRKAPVGVRAMIGVPLWIIGTVAIMALSTLWTGVISPAATLLLSWAAIALLAVLIYTLAVKAVFPDMPLKKILNKRSILGIGILCLIFGVADAALPLFWDDYLALSRIVKLVGSMICTGVPVIWFLRRRKREEPEEIVAEAVEEPEPKPEPTMEEKEAAARKLVQELADSVSRKI